MASSEGGMRALIINMASATERMGFMEAQMAALGLPWERIEAVTPETLVPPEQDPVWHRWQRPMRVTEMALCASHRVAWERVVALGAPCLVLEDDAVLAASLPGFLEAVVGLAGVEHISLEARGRKKLMGRRLHDRAPIRRLYQDRTGSAAYVVWPAGAAKLLAHARRAGAPSDALISSTYGMASWQADPALSVQLDHCEVLRRAAGDPDQIADRRGEKAAPCGAIGRRAVWLPGAAGHGAAAHGVAAGPVHARGRAAGCWCGAGLGRGARG
ncbi:MAG: glycosyltransferase family 25 protein [Roseicyclus sp.]|uniref:glycosyltransferase family 25 protein n=1 Tax=Roseicyclus sp. TaxID=1914329 RepID=UPI003A880807